MGDAQVINQEPDLANLRPLDGGVGGDEPSSITYFQTPEQDLARQKFILLSPHPTEAAAAGRAADHLAPIIHPAITAAHPEMVAQELYWKPMKATGLLAKLDSLLGKASDWVGGGIEKVAGTIGSINALNTLNALSQRRLAAGGPGRNQALDAQIEELKAKAPPEKHLGAVPAFILQMPYQMGYQGVTGAEAVANYVAAAVTLEPLRKMFNILPGTKFGQNATWAAEQFSGTFTGAVYQGLIDSGHTNANATAFALGGAVLQAAIFGIRIPGLSRAVEGLAGGAGKAFNTTLVASAEAAAIKTGVAAIDRAAIERVVAEAARESMLRPALSGTLAATAKRAVLTAGMQGTYGMISAAVNDSATVIADVVNNAAREKKIPLPAATQILEDLGIGFAGGVVMGVGAEGLGFASRLIRGGFLDRAVQDAAAQVDETTRVPAGTGEAIHVPAGEPISPDSGILPTKAQKALVEPKPDVPEAAPRTTIVAPIQPEGVPQFRFEDVPLSDIHNHPEIQQWKEKVEPLARPIRKGGLAPVVLMEGKDGKLYVATGRNRLDLFRREGEQTIPAHIFREADGFTPKEARIWDVESNILDEQGSVKDYAGYFRDTGITEEQAAARGLLARSKGKNGYALGAYASDELYAGFRNQVIGEERAAAIARGAPRDAVVQVEAMKASDVPTDQLETVTAGLLEQKMRMEATQGAVVDEQGKFPWEKSEQFNKELVKEAQAASRMTRKLKDELSVLNAARKVSGPERAEALAPYGKVDLNDAQIGSRITEINDQLQKMAGWRQDRELHNAVREEAGLPPMEYTNAPTPIVPSQETQADLFVAQPETRIGLDRNEVIDTLEKAIDDFGGQPLGSAAVELHYLMTGQGGRASEMSLLEAANEALKVAREDEHGVVDYGEYEIGQLVDAIRRGFKVGGQEKPIPVAPTQETQADLFLAAQNEPIVEKPAPSLPAKGEMILHDSAGDPVGPRQNKDVIYVGDIPVDRASFETDTLSKMKKPAISRNELKKGAPAGMWTAIRRLLMRGRGTANVIASSFDYNGEMVFGSKAAYAYKGGVGIPREAQTKVRPLARELSKSVMEDWAKEQKMGPTALGRFAMQEVKVGNTTLTRGEVWSAWMHFQNEDNKASLLSGQVIRRAADPELTMRNPITDAEFLKAFESLTPAEMDGLNRAAEALAKSGDLRGADYKDRHGTPMTRVEHYWPKDVVHSSEHNIDMEAMQESGRWMKVAPSESHSITRENVVVPLYLENFFQRYPEIMHDTSLIVNMAKPLEQAGKVMWNDAITSRIRATWGNAMVKSFHESLIEMAGRRQSAQSWMNAVDALRDLTISMDLGLNVKTGVKQMILGARSWPYVRGGAWLHALIETAVHPVRTRKLADATSRIYNESRRTGGTIELSRMLRDQNNLRRAGFMGVVGDVKRAMRKGAMFITKAGSNWSFKLDTIAAHNGAAFEFREAEKGGKFTDDFRAATGLKESDVAALTPEQKLQAGGKFADYIIGETHATALSAQRAGVMKNPVTRFMTTFKSEPIKAFEAWRRSIMQAHRNPSPSNTAKAIKSTLFYFMAEPLAFFALDYGWNALLDRKNKKGKPMRPNFAASAVMTYANYILGVGDVAQGIVDRIEYGSFASGGNVSGQAIGIASDAVYNLIKLSTEKNIAQRKKYTDAFWKSAATIGLASMDIPYRAPSVIVDSLWKKVTGK